MKRPLRSALLLFSCALFLAACATRPASREARPPSTGEEKAARAGALSKNALCDQAERAIAHLGRVACDTEEASDEESGGDEETGSCEGNLGSCSSEDQTLLGLYFECLLAVEQCEPGAELNWLMGLSPCESIRNRIGLDCQASF